MARAVLAENAFDAAEREKGNRTTPVERRALKGDKVALKAHVKVLEDERAGLRKAAQEARRQWLRSTNKKARKYHKGELDSLRAKIREVDQRIATTRNFKDFVQRPTPALPKRTLSQLSSQASSSG